MKRFQLPFLWRQFAVIRSFHRCIYGASMEMYLPYLQIIPTRVNPSTGGTLWTLFSPIFLWGTVRQKRLTRAALSAAEPTAYSTENRWPICCWNKTITRLRVKMAFFVPNLGNRTNIVPSRIRYTGIPVTTPLKYCLHLYKANFVINHRC